MNQSPATIDQPRLAFRADLEGLRAVAIALVVAAHAKVPGFAGGFVGVDVFFVLSGFLITGLLVRERQLTGKVDLLAFYARRVRRLLPALLLMVACASVLGELLLAPADRPAQGLAAVSASLWISNLYFAFSELDYFGAGADANLFLHTWSLGVEEQFYLVWPALLGLASLGAGTSTAAANPKLSRWLLATAIVSFIACVALTQSVPSHAFYLMPTRAWQFALGALVFLYFSEAKQRLPPWVAGLGLALLLASALLLGSDQQYPGLWALAPSLGAALVIAAGRVGVQSGVSHALTHRVLQAVGRGSYSWYLWHWPVLLLGAAVLDMDNGWNRLLLVAISAVLASASYWVVEAPIRHNQRLLSRPGLTVLASTGVMLLASSLALRWHNSASDWADENDTASARITVPVIYSMGCDDWFHSAEVRVCSFGDDKAPRTAVLMGDSIGLQWFPAFAEIFRHPQWRLLVITKSACPMVDAPIFYPRIGREYTECAQWRDEALATIGSINPELVIIGSTSTYNYSEQQWRDGTRSVLARLTAAARQVYVLRATPVLPFSAPACLTERGRLHEWFAGDGLCTANARTEASSRVFTWLSEAAMAQPNALVIDLTDAVCPGGVCRAQIDGMLTYRDNQHLNASFAASLAPRLAALLNLKGSTREAGTIPTAEAQSTK
ncbi:SGNH hydrolase domain-containing protein [Lysobacter sp. F6437]|uniref:SGNH hydrolase domain-containing protein n=1 Tax=Lysobacter sp. F6437 TaxID=3459296 RepID=UPI00403DA54C